ncbi:Factor of DNA methylation 2 [Quillaja saponaria]|uniref:Factor of DNA methylation 2 n=1 Tax=Quillaja saponaria TaxID=32244 RepID=A0AAD7PRL9_QUISA|nr:Factor of DNA methylation 2 [Quillaja saponaria]
MENHGYEEAMKMESTIVVKLMKEIDYKNQKLLEMEHKYDETTTTVRKLVVGLTLAINRKDRSLLEMEQKLDESSITVRWLENEKEKLHEEHHKQLEKLKFMNSRLNHDMECLKKEFGQLAKELKDNKVHNELERQGFVDEIEKCHDSVVTVTA